MPALIVSYSSHPGGAERILNDHATAIGPDAIAACPEGWLADRLREQGIRVFPLEQHPLDLRAHPPAAAVRLASHARELRSLVEALRPHTLVAWGMRTALAATAALVRLEQVPRPRLVFQHNDLLPGPAVARAVRAAAAKADLVLALSQTIADDLGLPAHVNRPGVDLRKFAPLQHPPRKPAVLFLGAITPWKRPELAVEAAKRAGMALTIAGAPIDPAGRRLEERLRRDGSATLAGRVPDPAKVLQNASFLLHCADREPYGMAVVESLACGVPVVAPAAGGPREITDDSCARLYRPGDPDAAAAALTAAATADRAQLSRAARARAIEHFDLADSRRRYTELLAHPTSRSPGAGIALVTVLHDSEPEIAALMASIDRHLPGAHLIAVDCASSDGGPAAVSSWTGNKTLIELDRNAGYGPGTNAGVAAATEPVTIVVNPDVELLDDSLAQLAAQAASNPHRILAPLVLLPDGRRQDSVHPDPASAPEVFRAVVPRLAAGLDPWRSNEPRRVGWAVGCCLAAQTDTLKQLGPFDPSAFLYAEDLDLGLRAAEHGVETWFWPHARVLHKRAHSTGAAFGGEPFELLAGRRRQVIEERRGPAAARRDDLVQAATFANRIALKTLLRKPAARERSQLRAVVRSRGRSAR